MDYDVIIGLEIHTELQTKSKMFCACDNDSEGKPANSTVCPICLGHPGTLPIPNRAAIEATVLLGLALNGKINQLSKFDRKNYFYPDLPKGYQISQYDLPFVYEGYLEFDDKKIAITRIHLEEDTGKLTHPKNSDYTLIDFNRAGTPLVELVTEPVIPDATTAKKFCQKYQQILRYLNLSAADMEKGQMRCEVNISLQTKGQWEYVDNQIKPIGDSKLNPKVEVKNINSFRAVEKAIEYEIKRQTEALNSGTELFQETRGWDDDKNITVSQRLKETSADYRYFPEPDIPPIKITNEKINELKSRLIELPEAKKTRFERQYEIKSDLAEILISDKELAGWFEEVISELGAWIEAGDDIPARQEQRLATTAANLIVSELLKYKLDYYPPASDFAQLVSLLYLDKINSSAGQLVLKTMIETKNDPASIIKELNLEQMDNSAELEKIITDVMANNPEQVASYRAGKLGLLQYLVGQVMATTKGKANPKIVTEILQAKLK